MFPNKGIYNVSGVIAANWELWAMTGYQTCEGRLDLVPCEGRQDLVPCEGRKDLVPCEGRKDLVPCEAERI